MTTANGKSAAASGRERAIERCRERGVLIPTFAQMRDPSLVPIAVKATLAGLDMQKPDPANLFRITWKNDLASSGFGRVNVLELPRSLTGVSARVAGLLGRHFPTGAHKVGAAFGCLVPRLVSGGFDPSMQKAVWPSTGNYCRGGVFDSALLGCRAVAILPREMSAERFRWLEAMGAEIVATPGCESNVKEIFDACWEIRKNQPEAVIFNQFEEFGNHLWHWAVTGPAVHEAFVGLAKGRSRLAAWVSATGSAGTLGAGNYLKELLPGVVVTASEALQCPTLLGNGFGAHRIEGIGDKHVPWIHDVRSTDFVAAIDDEAALRVFRLFNEPAGQDLLVSRGVPQDVVADLPLLGISGAANLLAALKTARWYEMTDEDVLMTVFTDSSQMYLSRLGELAARLGPYGREEAAVDFERYLLGATTDHVRELTYPDRRALHNLKYFTWVEQQGRSAGELDALWSPRFWSDLHALVPEWDSAIEKFNRETGVLAGLERRFEHP